MVSDEWFHRVLRGSANVSHGLHGVVQAFGRNASGLFRILRV